MGTKICMNSSCGTAAAREWKRGWPLRSGLFADLCYTCGSAYEKSVYCDTFHLEESGWRECSICGKRLHCGCIASKSLVELLDYGGVGCASCATSSRLHSIQGGRVQKGFGSLTTSSAGDAKSSTIEDRVAGNCIEEGNLPQLCRFNEANDTNLTCKPAVGDGNACHQQFRQEEIRHPIANAAQLTFDSSKFGQPDNIRSMLDMRNMHGSLAQPSSSMTLGAPPGKETFAPFSSIPTPFQQGQRSRPILPKPSKAGFTMNPQNNKTVASELRIARPPGEGRGKSQLLPRYWPRITDQELQQISGDLNSNVVPLFEKVLSASDAGRIGRLVLPKACAEAYFPPISQSEGVPLRIQDVKGREWTFQFRFWPNNNSRMYVLEGVTPCIQAMQLRAGDTITFSRIDPSGKLVVGYRKATNVPIASQDGQPANLTNGPTSGEASYSADGDAGLNKSENSGGRTNGDSLQEPIPNTEKKRTRNIGPKSKRLLMNSEDALELRLTWEEAQDLLRPSPSAKPSVVTIEDHEFEEYDEPPVFGKRTIFTAQPSGLREQWAQCDDCSKWRKLPVGALLPPKWTCSDNAWDAHRCTCSAPEEMTAKDLDNLLRGSKDLKKRRIMGSHNGSEDCEPSGLDALASAAVLGDSVGDAGEPSVGATTRHPRHRPGCTCIVCIQPPSGKGKHKPNCTCNVCMTVKRRFKTLMLRKKKRQSEREAEILQRENIERRDESEINGSLDSANEVNQNRNLNEVAETSAAQIDLNCHPNRDDMQVDVQGVSVMNLVNAANPALDNYDRQNGLANLISENGVASSLLPQANGENLRRLSDEAFLASIGWDREGRNN